MPGLVHRVRRHADHLAVAKCRAGAPQPLPQPGLDEVARLPRAGLVDGGGQVEGGHGAIDLREVDLRRLQPSHCSVRATYALAVVAVHRPRLRAGARSSCIVRLGLRPAGRPRRRRLRRRRRTRTRVGGQPATADPAVATRRRAPRLERWRRVQSAAAGRAAVAAGRAVAAAVAAAAAEAADRRPGRRRPARGRRRGDRPREPALVGRRRRRLPRRARRLPRRRRLRLVPGEPARGRRPAARRRRGRGVLEVGCGAAMCSRWLAGHGARRSRSTCPRACCGTPAPQRRPHRHRRPARAGRRAAPAVPRRPLRPRVHRVRRDRRSSRTPPR